MPEPGGVEQLPRRPGRHDRLAVGVPDTLVPAVVHDEQRREVIPPRRPGRYVKFGHLPADPPLEPAEEAGPDPLAKAEHPREVGRVGNRVGYRRDEDQPLGCQAVQGRDGGGGAAEGVADDGAPVPDSRTDQPIA